MSLSTQLAEMGFENYQIEAALKSGKVNNLEQAIDWLMLNPNAIPESSTSETTGPTLNLNASNQSATTAENPASANSLKCDECGKLLKDADAATAHALRSNHSSFSECTEEIKPLTPEEREAMKKRVEERIAARRVEQKAEEERKNIEMEKKRIADGKALSELKQKRDEAEMKKIAEANRREKLETQLAKQRAIEQIEADKRARREKAAAEKAGASSLSEISTTKTQPVATTQPQPAKQYDECNLQVRFPDGSVSRQTFKAVDLFEKVMEWARSIQSGYPFILIQNFPRKEFSESDNYKSLTALGLVPSGSLMVKQLTHFQN